MEMPQRNVRIETIPSSKLLNFVKKDDLIRLLGERFRPIQAEANASGAKLTASFIKGRVAPDNEFMDRFRRSPEGQRAFQKYLDTKDRLTRPETKAKRIQVRKLMSEPRRGFLGCVATKLDPDDFKYCVENYDRDEYQNISLVPSSGLKQSAWGKTGELALTPGPRAHISNLPRGLRAYILAHPDQYASYLRERKAELDLLRSVRRNLAREQEEGMQPPQLPLATETEPIGPGPKRRRPEVTEV